MEAMNIAGGSYGQLAYQLAGSPPVTTVHRTFETPSIEPTLDGYAGFCTNSRAQFDAFLHLIERTDLLGDEQLAMFVGRQQRWTEWNEAVHAWTTQHSTAEVVKLAAELRIPVAPVLNGETVLDCEHFVARNVFVDDPTGTFKMPRPAWRLDDADPPPPRPSPRLGEHDGRVEVRPPTRPAAPIGDRRLPLDGVRVVDLTAWWAGPVASGMIAALGADVIHVESVGRPDGMRMTGRLFGSEGAWWERASHYLCANANKRDLTLDLTQPVGRELLQRLVAESDAIIENFTPRVLANFGLTWDDVRALNERCILVRMPAFGLSGPWRDNSGFAQTMEQVSGLAWITGHPWDQPRIQRGPSDPNVGMHAAFALVVGLARRDATGLGCQFEVTMVEGALERRGRDRDRAQRVRQPPRTSGEPQPARRAPGPVRVRGVRPVARGVRRDRRAVAGSARRARGAGMGRRSRPRQRTPGGGRATTSSTTGSLDGARRSTPTRPRPLLLAHGVPAAAPRDPRLMLGNPQLQHRGYHEEVDHPVVGRKLLPGMPFRFASIDERPGGGWIRRRAPLLGEHNAEILGDLGVDDATTGGARARAGDRDATPMSRAVESSREPSASASDDATHADVLIVGAGASGGVVARRLAEAGIGVVCLEQGDWPDRAGFRGAEPDWELTARKQWSSSPAIRLAPSDYPVDVSHSDVGVLNFNGVGGGTVLYAAQWPRLLPSDFRVRSLDGVADDWPISYDDLLPYYERTDAQIGVSGLGGNPAYPPGADPPLPPLPIGRAGLLVARGARPARLALVAGHERDPLGAVRRPARVRATGDVHAGLWRGREGVDRPDPLAAGDRARRPSRHRRARPPPGHRPARARRRARSGSTPTAASTCRRPTSCCARRTASAPRACSWRRRPSTQPDGLANSSGLVGRRLMMHPLTTVLGVFDDELESWQGQKGSTIQSLEFYETDESRGLRPRWTLGARRCERSARGRVRQRRHVGCRPPPRVPRAVRAHRAVGADRRGPARRGEPGRAVGDAGRRLGRAGTRGALPASPTTPGG